MTKVRSDELYLLARGIKRALLNRQSKLKMSIDENGWMWIKDENTREVVRIDLEGEVEQYVFDM